MSGPKRIETDFLVVGSGIAGLYTSLHLSRLGEIEVITKNEVKESSTQYAQGGIAAVLDKGDSWELHMEDTLEAGADFCDEEAVELMVKEGPDRVRELIELGTDFDYVEENLDLAKEGAHSRRRILHARGDATGEEIRESLTEAVKKDQNISINEKMFLIDLMSDGERVEGAVCLDLEARKVLVISSSNVVLASGGCGQVYENTTNPTVSTGDGVAVAYRAGADITDMEFIQFHPTALYNPDGQSFLISESVRGEGGFLRDEEGQRFMLNYHEDAELAPRDVVSRAIVEVIEAQDDPYVNLDVTHLDDQFIKGRFPKIYGTLKDIGMNMTTEYIPVIPSAHYMIGGVKTDLYGRTSLEGLYSCGEVACTGVHGANRLASNSLLEGLVFGHRIYQGLRDEGKRSGSDISYEMYFNVEEGRKPEGMGIDVGEKREKIKMQMEKNAGISRNERGLRELKDSLEKDIKKVEDIYSKDLDVLELKNMLTVGRLIASSALLREESRGTHFRDDHPESKSKYSNMHTLFNKEQPHGEIR